QRAGERGAADLEGDLDVDVPRRRERLPALLLDRGHPRTCSRGDDDEVRVGLGEEGGDLGGIGGVALAARGQDTDAGGLQTGGGGLPDAAAGADDECVLDVHGGPPFGVTSRDPRSHPKSNVGFQPPPGSQPETTEGKPVTAPTKAATRWVVALTAIGSLMAA